MEKTYEQRIRDEWKKFMPADNGEVMVERRHGSKTVLMPMRESQAKLESFLDGDQRSALKEIHLAFEILTAQVKERSMSYGAVYGKAKDEYSQYTIRLLQRYSAWTDFCKKQGKCPMGMMLIMDTRDRGLNEIGLREGMRVTTFCAMYVAALDIYLDIKERQAKDKPMRLSLTERMQECKDYMLSYADTHGYDPKVEEVAAALSTRVSNAFRLMDCLVERGHAFKRCGVSRGTTAIP
ncbi:MAG: hypothetical protein ACRBCK_10035 [Alphaproteobacteria bacterium]